MSTNPYGVLLARPGDEDEIFSHLTLLHNENGLFPISPDKVLITIREGIYGKSVIGLIRGSSGNIEASIGLAFTDVWYSDWWHWSEMWLYVHPDHRRTTHAKRLTEFAKWCSDEMTVRVKGQDEAQKEIPLLIGILTKHNLESKMRLYQRHFQQVGATFMHNGVPDDVFMQRRLG